MTFPALVMVTAALSASAPDAQSSVVRESTISAVSADAQQTREPRSRRLPGDRPHSVGIGGQAGVSNRGGGGSMRLFFGERVGVNMNVVWYRSGGRYTSDPGTGSTFAAMPSVLFMLSKQDPTKGVDVRPYVGGGLSYVRATGSATTAQFSRRSGTGGQVFGGVEMTFSDADWMTISGEGVYYKLPVSYVNASTVDGFNVILAFHFYLR